MPRSPSLHPWVASNRGRRRSFVPEMLGDQETLIYNRVYFAIREGWVEGVTQRGRIRKSVAQEGADSRAALTRWENGKRAGQHPSRYRGLRRATRSTCPPEEAHQLNRDASWYVPKQGELFRKGELHAASQLLHAWLSLGGTEGNIGTGELLSTKESSGELINSLVCDREASGSSSNAGDGVGRCRKNSIPTQPQLPFLYH